MRTLIELFRVLSAKTLAQRQIEESERQWVKHIEHAGLRDHFAGLAMPAHMQALSSMQTDPGKWHEVIANLSYKTADAMLEARKCEP